MTYEIAAYGARRFVKWTPAGSGIDLEQEIARLRWAVDWIPVPEVLDHGSDDAGSWMITGGLDGENAVTERWLASPASAVPAIGRGLRVLHDLLPVTHSPFSWSAHTRVADARERADRGEITSAGWHLEHRHFDVATALRIAEEAPDVDHLVVCHGDACAPNTLIGEDGVCSGHVDLGSLGIADRWADLAVATWSATWNYGPGWEPILLEAYGVDPDPVRTAYYRLLWDLDP